MKLQKQSLATIGLIFITFLAAIQYVFLRNVPDSVSTFAFVCITNLIGLVILGISQPKKLFSINVRTMAKGVVFAVELTGFNFFLLMGSKHLDAVIISSVVSLYFVFITPILLLLRKRVNFFSGIATVIAIISLLLMFGADTDALFASGDVVYLILADLFFAMYVISVSILGQNVDPTQLTLSQMIFSSLFAFAGWGIECLISGNGFSLPTDTKFWVSALFIGVFIRAVYGLIQITCQQYVPALKASLIFSTEIVITLLMNPVLCRVLDMEYTPVTIYQVFGGVLLIIATLMVDDTVMGRLGYKDIQSTTYKDVYGNMVERRSVSKKMIMTTLTFAMVTLVLATLTFLSSISFIRSNAIENSTELGENASAISSEAMMQKLEESIQNQARDKALLAEQKLAAYSDAVTYASAYATALYQNPENYPNREVDWPNSENAGIWAMQRTLANEYISYDDLREKNCLLGNMEDLFASIAKNGENITSIYMGTDDGLLLSYDTYSDTGDNGGVSYYEYRTTLWYLQGKSKGTASFTKTYQDGYGRGLTITCVAPFYNEYGQVAGCIAMDILMNELNESMVNDGIVAPSEAIMIDNKGNYIAGKEVDPLADDMGSIYDVNDETPLREVGKTIFRNKSGIESYGEGEDEIYIAYSTIESTKWSLCILSPVSSVIKPALAIRDSIDENTGKVVSTVNQGILNVIQSLLLMMACILLLITMFAGRYSRKISDPLNQLEADVRHISGGNLDLRTKVMTDDEIGSLATSFNYMTDSLQKYIADLKEVTAKEQRIAGELAVATHIQASMLPQNFEEFSAGQAFELYASMNPAKEVGGDFYDFFMVDDDHVALVMADVSGKGVPAAMFMAIAKTLIKNHAQLGESPSETLHNTNEQLCEGNDAQLFVTVWMAIIQLSTGKGFAVNAGHEHPALRRAGGQYELIKYRHSPAVATMEGMRFREHEFELYPGDSLFVYTDGVTEATDAHDELFGDDRLIEALNKDPGARPEQILKNVRAGIDAFVKEAEQFDDITMLNFVYNVQPKQDEAKKMTIDAKIENLNDVLAFVDAELEAKDCSPKAQMQLDIAVEEIFVNIAHYAYAPETGTADITVDTEKEPGNVIITFVDSGIPYDPLAKPDPDVTLSAEERQIGGLGIFMVKNTMDDMQYEYKDGHNVLTIKKTI